MHREVQVDMGGIAVSNDESEVLTTLVGSCVALCLYDPYAKVAGMAHVMLPKSNNGRSPNGSGKAGKYADQAVDNLLRMMAEKGAEPRRIRAKMAGGANMFSHEGSSTVFNIGERNAEELRRILRERGIPLVSEDIGENYGRLTRFSVKTGELVVVVRNSGERRL